MEAVDRRKEWSVRPATFDDVERTVEMFNARSQVFHNQNQSTVDEIAGWWRSPRFDLATDTRIVLDDRGRMMGWAHVWDPGEPYVSPGCGVVVHPEIEDDDGLWDRLFSWAVGRAGEFIPLAPRGARVAVSTGALDKDLARRNAAERAGFRIVRVTNSMRIDLDADLQANEVEAGGFFGRILEHRGEQHARDRLHLSVRGAGCR